MHVNSSVPRVNAEASGDESAVLDEIACQDTETIGCLQTLNTRTMSTQGKPAALVPTGDDVSAANGGNDGNPVDARNRVHFASDADG